MQIRYLITTVFVEIAAGSTSAQAPPGTHSPNIMNVGHTVSEISSGQKSRTADGESTTDIWNAKSLPELHSGETKSTF